MFEIGQMVVCIRWNPAPGSEYFPHAELGQIVTIAGFCTKHDDGIGLYLEEIPPHGDPDWCKCQHSDDFRPVRPTNIEELRKLVVPLKTKEVAK